VKGHVWAVFPWALGRARLHFAAEMMADVASNLTPGLQGELETTAIENVTGVTPAISHHHFLCSCSTLEEKPWYSGKRTLFLAGFSANF
jgi:hypothetical protein